MNNNQLHLLSVIMVVKGISHVVASPGSRNAPAIVVFNRKDGLLVKSIADERSAGFYALGMAQQLKKPVALLCTSGSAALNYAPAIAEAYYQKVPLLVITADRPEAWIDQGDGQTIRQRNVFSGYVRKSFHLPQQIKEDESAWLFKRMVSEAIDRTTFPAAGPVHINLPLSEPLYDIKWPEKQSVTKIPSVAATETRVNAAAMAELSQRWNTSPSKIILAGQMNADDERNQLLAKLTEDASVILLSESTSNLKVHQAISCIDRTIEGIGPEEMIHYRPSLLLTIGGAIVSKKIKTLLRKMQPTHHWHINADTDDFHLDTFQSLTHTIPVGEMTFLKQLCEQTKPLESNFKQLWLERSHSHAEKHNNFVEAAPFSDLKVYETLFREIPREGQLHLGNSTPVRYAQLFDEASGFINWANRGTSGIDGCISTAAGAAEIFAGITTVITGDIGFFYDSNALWNSHLSPRLRIVVINNGGGNIFRVIPGPDKYEELEAYIETTHNLNTEGLAKNFGVNYYPAHSQEQLENALQSFFKPQENSKPALLEVFTENKCSAQVLNDYFKYLPS
jgi:2-succinyl-5-enolpyruvyl-6-hydroxy-3-cyclohexene-1-carboxylate synthase